MFWLGAGDTALRLAGWVGRGARRWPCSRVTPTRSCWPCCARCRSRSSNVGQTFYGFGWELQLVETGFLCIFLCPLLDARPFPRRPPPATVIWLLRWLAVRIMWGAGLIKLRGDPCWRDLTCLDFHFETQPIPNPLSPFFHQLPALRFTRAACSSITWSSWWRRSSCSARAGCALAAGAA